MAARSARPARSARRWVPAAVLALALLAWRTNLPSPPVDREAPPGFETGFTALPGTESLPAPAETSILRVRIAKSELRQYGFDVPPAVAADFIRADFVVGEDGLARAVRLVQ